MRYTHLTSSFFFLEVNDRTFLIRTIPFQIYEVPSIERAIELAQRLEKDKNSIAKPYSNYFSLELVLTTKCNLACKYCYARSDKDDVGYYGLKPMNMDFSTAKRAVDFSMNLLIKNMITNNKNEGIFDIYFISFQ